MLQRGEHKNGIESVQQKPECFHRTIALKSILSNRILSHDSLRASVKECGQPAKRLPGTAEPFGSAIPTSPSMKNS